MPGLRKQAECLPIAAEDVPSLLAWAEKEKIDLTVVGPEAPLTLGIVDVFEARGLRIFGPSQRAAEIEGSKAFAKEIMKKYGIPSGEFQTFEDYPRRPAIRSGKRARPLSSKPTAWPPGKGSFSARTRKKLSPPWTRS